MRCRCCSAGRRGRSPREGADRRRDACRRRFRPAFPRRCSSGGPMSSRRSSSSSRPTPTSARRRRCSIPTISLTGFLGGISGDLTSAPRRRRRRLVAGAGLLQPIFQAGRIRRNLEAAQARYDAGARAYQKAALNGYREVADALVTIQKLAELRVQRAGRRHGAAGRGRSGPLALRFGPRQLHRDPDRRPGSLPAAAAARRDARRRAARPRRALPRAGRRLAASRG